MKKKDIILIGVCIIGLVLIMIGIYKLLTTPDSLGENNNIPPITEFNPENFHTNTEETTVEEEAVTKPETEPEVIVEEAVTEPEPEPDKLSPNDDMIYGAMATSQYKDLCKKFNVDLRVGITKVEETDEGIVITFILDNTDATFTATELNGTTAYSDIVNVYDDEYPIVYFPDGVPDASSSLYGYIDATYHKKAMIANIVTDTYYELLDVDSGDIVTGYTN